MHTVELVKVGSRAICGLLIVSLVAGCAANSNAVNDTALLAQDGAGLSPDEQVLLAQAKRHASTRLAGAGTGTVAGAAAAGSACRLATDDPLAVALCALTGAVAGGLGGYAAGDYVAERNRQADVQQDDLHARIAAADADIARYEAANASAARVISERRDQVDRLNADFQSGQLSAAAYRSEMKGLQVSILSLSSLAAEAEGNADVVDKDVVQIQSEGGDPGPLAARRDQLRAANTLLQAQLTELLAVVDKVPGEVGLDKEQSA